MATMSWAVFAIAPYADLGRGGEVVGCMTWRPKALARWVRGLSME